MSKPADKRALGKGLSALLPGNRTSAPAAAQTESAQGGIQQVPIDSIQPNPLQPRSIFQPERLQELAQSIRANGIIQPLIVQKTGDQTYQLVAGERRWRAARLAGLQHVPVVIQQFAQDRLLEVALIENIQREDLNPIEVAQALDRLSREHALSHEEIGRRTGKDRSTITNLLRLLKLPPEVQVLVAEHRLSMGHARAILGLSDDAQQRQLAERSAAQGLSVRQVERLVQDATSRRDPATSLERTASKTATPDANVSAAVRELEAILGTRVRIVQQTADRGRIEIDYFSVDELDRLYSLIVK